ncbi:MULTISPECIES: protein adenylyltransferase Fic [Veillonella]|uniref:protein adenylyltransferase n=1 Tax=Veillonella infantium TaxID=1911679 RepID=A0ABX5C1U2_9FIRM|nr:MULTISPECIES: Fic family protein [Veillonella]PQL23120.1 cell filamentation protein Fic [Veillonella sp. T14073-2]PQL57344.1 cell filamentation protein Fic [Veillonella infantium]
MVITNKLGITDSPTLAREEERISKKSATRLFEQNLLNNMSSGTWTTLQDIHKVLFQDIYDFAGELRTVNISKGNFRFVPVMYLSEAIKTIESMPQNSFDEIVEKYVEMNVAHPFREGNGRSMRLWLDHMLCVELQKTIDWSQIDKEKYLSAMERSPVNDLEIKAVLAAALTDDINNRELFMKGLDHSYYFEGYQLFKSEDL